MAEAVLPADLAELTGPIGKYAGKTSVRQIGAGGVAAAIEAPAHGPASIDAIFGGSVHAEGMLGLKDIDGRQLVACAPKELGAEQEIFVNGAAKRLPTKGSVRAI